MMYPLLMLNDGTEIVHSEKLENGKVKVYIEKPDEKDCFHHISCFLPDYDWVDNFGFQPEEVHAFQEIVEASSNLIMGFAGDEHLFLTLNDRAIIMVETAN